MVHVVFSNVFLLHHCQLSDYHPVRLGVSGRVVHGAGKQLLSKQWVFIKAEEMGEEGVMQYTMSWVCLLMM